MKNTVVKSNEISQFAFKQSMLIIDQKFPGTTPQFNFQVLFHLESDTYLADDMIVILVNNVISC